MPKIPIPSKQIDIASITGANITSNSTNTPYLIFNVTPNLKLLFLSGLYACQHPRAKLSDTAFCNIYPIASRNFSWSLRKYYKRWILKPFNALRAITPKIISPNRKGSLMVSLISVKPNLWRNFGNLIPPNIIIIILPIHAKITTTKRVSAAIPELYINLIFELY